MLLTKACRFTLAGRGRGKRGWEDGCKPREKARRRAEFQQAVLDGWPQWASWKHCRSVAGQAIRRSRTWVERTEGRLWGWEVNGKMEGFIELWSREDRLSASCAQMIKILCFSLPTSSSPDMAHWRDEQITATCLSYVSTASALTYHKQPSSLLADNSTLPSSSYLHNVIPRGHFPPNQSRSASPIGAWRACIFQHVRLSVGTSQAFNDSSPILPPKAKT